MSQDSLNIIIGALIGVIPSLLVAYFGYRFQMRQKEMERKWSLEDLKKRQKKDVLERRIDRVEKLSMQWYDLFNYAAFNHYEIFNKEHGKRYISTLIVKINRLATGTAFAFSLNDELITREMENLICMKDELGKYLMSLPEDEDGDIYVRYTQDENTKFTTKVEEYAEKAFQPLIEIVTRLDEIRIKQLV